MSHSRYTLVVCFDAETTDLTTRSTITQLCRLMTTMDRTLVYYAVSTSYSYISSGLTRQQSPTTMKTLLKMNSILDYISHHLSHASILRDLVVSAYRFLMQKCAFYLKAIRIFLSLLTPLIDVKDTQICIFGSSRGALAARVLAGMLHSVCFFTLALMSSMLIGDDIENLAGSVSTRIWCTDSGSIQEISHARKSR